MSLPPTYTLHLHSEGRSHHGSLQNTPERQLSIIQTRKELGSPVFHSGPWGVIWGKEHRPRKTIKAPGQSWDSSFPSFHSHQLRPLSLGFSWGFGISFEYFLPLDFGVFFLLGQVFLGIETSAFGLRLSTSTPFSTSTLNSSLSSFFFAIQMKHVTTCTGWLGG